jgi:hypothetical protein
VLLLQPSPVALLHLLLLPLLLLLLLPHLIELVSHC